MAEMLFLSEGEEFEFIGSIERIIFHNGENGYTVLKVQPDKSLNKENNIIKYESVSCVGYILAPKVGDSVKIKGKWVKNPKFGRQISFSQIEKLLPATNEGIRLYLSSGLIKGLGPELASRIVKKFGNKTLEILDKDPEQLLKIKGIGKKNFEKIVVAWEEHHGIRDLMLFLQPHGISASYAIKIYKAYGSSALEIVRENPYRLAMDIHGIGFLTADLIARKIGFDENSPLRIQAGTLYILLKSSEDGHVYLPEQELVEEVIRQLNVEENLVYDAIAFLIRGERLVKEEFQNGECGIYLKRFHHCESKIAYYLLRLMRSPKSVVFENPEKVIENVMNSLPITLAKEQVLALKMATEKKVMILTGGPGTGKTTIINAIIKVFSMTKTKILLAAPTGRAAKKMAESCQNEAKTIHRLLEYSPKEDGFGRNEDCPLACGLLVIDEASMVDVPLFYHLLKAIPLGATVVFVGDMYQLPSVGPGNVLSDMISCKHLPVVKLDEIFRQSAESEIVCNAHMINHGIVPKLESNKERLSDFYFIRQDDPEKVSDLIVDLVKNHIPRRFKLDSVNDIQVLTPMHKGLVGAHAINSRLQDALNPNGFEIKRGDKCFRLHDKVMQIRNNYDKDIFNGDIGKIVYIDQEDKAIKVNFDDREVIIAFEELDEVVPAYAISIHKSQGSEYPAIIIPIMMQHYVLLQRNLIYTGVTRGKKLVILIGDARALNIAVKNNKTRNRYTRLSERLEKI